MNEVEFENLLGPGKAARLRELVDEAEADPDRLYDRVYGDCDDNEFTNEAVRVFAALACRLYGRKAVRSFPP
jgi:hypothetical protein